MVVIATRHSRLFVYPHQKIRHDRWIPLTKGQWCWSFLVVSPSWVFIFRAVTKKLAQFHAVDPEKVPLVGKDGTIRTFDKTPTWEKLARDILKQYPTDLKDPEKNKMWVAGKIMKHDGISLQRFLLLDS